MTATSVTTDPKAPMGPPVRALMPAGTDRELPNTMPSAGIVLPASRHEAWFVPAPEPDDGLDATLRAARDAFVVAGTER